MKSNTSLNPLYFEFNLFTDFGPLKYLFFTLCLLIYLIIISVNVVIVLAVCLEKSLHQPMYIFICCLCCNSLYGSVGFFPRFLMDIVSDTHFIPRTACFIQVYIVNSYIGFELTFLTAMAYDRFVAICHPLHYHSKMTLRMVKLLVCLSVLCPTVSIGSFTQRLNTVNYCGNKLNRIFCQGWPLTKLSCEEDATVVNIAGQTSIVTTTVIVVSFILYTYLRILLVCRRSSSEVRGKAIHTCLPHIVTFVNYCTSVLCEFSLTRYNPDESNTVVVVVASLEYLIIPPINNPLIYGLTLPLIRGVIFRHFRFNRVRPACKQQTQCTQKTANKV